MNYGDRITVATDVLVGKPIIKEPLAKVPFRHSGEGRNRAPVSALNQRGESPLQVCATACNRL